MWGNYNNDFRKMENVLFNVILYLSVYKHNNFVIKCQLSDTDNCHFMKKLLCLQTGLIYYYIDTTQRNGSYQKSDLIPTIGVMNEAESKAGKNNYPFYRSSCRKPTEGP